MTPMKPTDNPKGTPRSLHGGHGATGLVQPRWWTEEHISGWSRVKEAFRRDWEQTKNDVSFGKAGTDLDQDVPDTLKHAAGTKPIPPASVVTRKDDEFTQHEPAFRYGFGARRFYTDYPRWDEKLESKLKTEWTDLKTGQSWDESRDFIRRGFDYPV